MINRPFKLTPNMLRSINFFFTNFSLINMLRSINFFFYKLFSSTKNFVDQSTFQTNTQHASIDQLFFTNFKKLIDFFSSSKNLKDRLTFFHQVISKGQSTFSTHFKKSTNFFLLTKFEEKNVILDRTPMVRKTPTVKKRSLMFNVVKRWLKMVKDC